MIPKQEMVRLLLSDPNYTLPDVDYSTPNMYNRLIRIRTNIVRLQTILDQADPEERRSLTGIFNEEFPGFKRTLIPYALIKLNNKLPGISPTAGSRKKKRKKGLHSKLREIG